MLRTNSKKAVENLKNYIMEAFDGTNYGIDKPETFEETAVIIYAIYKSEYIHGCNKECFDTFASWCAGLPSILDTCYYYNKSAIEDLAAILEESAAESAKYSESDAELMLTRLIYRELTKAKDVFLKGVIYPDQMHKAALLLLSSKDIDHHGSDLYIRVTPASRDLIKHFKYSYMITTFIDGIDNVKWFDIPFCYDSRL